VTAAPAEAVPAVSDVASATPLVEAGSKRAFEVHLPVFSGPFDLLLSLIAKHKLDVTEVALAEVADEFVAHIRAAGFDLDQATEFLVVAATLLDLKAARLLPVETREDEEEDLALLEARDLLFARLLQYRAYKRAAALLSGLEEMESRHTARLVPLEEPFAAALPEVVLTIDPAGLAELAARRREPPAPPEVAVDHVHAPRVDVPAHRRAVVERLRAVGTASFRSLCAGCQETLEVVVRFLALLELHREGTVSFDQPVALGELTVTWTGGTEAVEPVSIENEETEDDLDVSPGERQEETA
jgi:segregation and condensation protein A